MILLLSQTPASYAAENIAGPVNEKGAYAAEDNAETAGETAYERVVAHGGGAYRGYETSNSVEALNNAIASGYKIIELDMDLSSDNKIIMLHDWDRTAKYYYGSDFPKKLSKSQFTRLSVFGELEVLTFDKLVKILENNQDIRIVTDTKGDNLQILTAISETCPDLLDRFIPQIYGYDQWSEVKGIGYRDIILTLYAMADPDAEKAASFAGDHGLYAVAMPDYMAGRGLCRQIADRGVKVYVHPVSGYEDALRYMKLGAYGVYSGFLLPEEFEGIEKDHYLTLANPDGSATKLTDDRIDDWNELKLYGMKTGETAFYYVDGSRLSADDASIAGLKPGKHELTVRISDQEGPLGDLKYYLWKDAGGLRILHKKYEYRLEEVKQEKDFRSAMQNGNIPEEAREILERSLIAKEGEYSYYLNGTLENYMNGEEFLPVRKGGFGKLLLPMNTTLTKLGADSVTMSRDKDIAVAFNGENSLIMAGSSIVRRGFMITRLNGPVVLYLNKAMAGGEYYRNITGRNYIEKNGCMIILPEGVSPDRDMEEQLLASAEKLF